MLVGSCTFFSGRPRPILGFAPFPFFQGDCIIPSTGFGLAGTSRSPLNGHDSGSPPMNFKKLESGYGTCIDQNQPLGACALPSPACGCARHITHTAARKARLPRISLSVE